LSQYNPIFAQNETCLALKSESFSLGRGFKTVSKEVDFPVTFDAGLAQDTVSKAIG
jgi:hypothetical protein